MIAKIENIIIFV